VQPNVRAAPSRRFTKPTTRLGLPARALRSKLARVEGLGTLQVTTRDDKAEVFVDGQFKGRGRAVTQQLAAGAHRVHIVVGGRKSKPKDIELRSGARLTVEF
jgi:hypothetical protein